MNAPLAVAKVVASRHQSNLFKAFLNDTFTERYVGASLRTLEEKFSDPRGGKYMAKMHSRARGVSGSKKPIGKSKPTWMAHSEKEIELLIAKRAKEGKSPSQIGLYLRDAYGVPNLRVALKKKLGAVLKEKKLTPELPEDLLSLIRRSVQVSKHLEQNRHDMTAKRGLLLTESKIRRLVKYYKGVGRLPQDWKFDAKSIRLHAE